LSCRKRVEFVDRHAVFARRSAEREEPLLAALELARVMVGGAQRSIQVRAGIFERRERSIERLHGRPDQRGGLRRATFEPTHSGREGRHRRLRTGHRLLRFTQVACDFFRLHHGTAPLGKHALLGGLGFEAREFLDRVPKPLGFALCAFERGAFFPERRFARALVLPQSGDLTGLAIERAERIEQRTMCRGIDERTLVMLPVNLDQGATEILENLRAHRLVVGKGTRAAIGELDAAQDQLIVSTDADLRHDGARRMPPGRIEGRRHLSLARTLAHQRNIAARAERKGKGVEQDRLAGAGLACEHGKPIGEIDVEPIDQDNVANGQPGEHAGSGRTKKDGLGKLSRDSLFCRPFCAGFPLVSPRRIAGMLG
jgi:hypothetical protein